MPHASEILASKQDLPGNGTSALPPQHQPQENRQSQQAERQEFRNSHVTLGVATHLIKTAGALSPLIILEFVKEPTRAHRWIKIASIASAGINEALWASRIGRSRTDEWRRKGFAARR
jgi:hypothetical protein